MVMCSNSCFNIVVIHYTYSVLILCVGRKQIILKSYQVIDVADASILHVKVNLLPTTNFLATSLSLESVASEVIWMFNE